MTYKPTTWPQVDVTPVAPTGRITSVSLFGLVYHGTSRHYGLIPEDATALAKELSLVANRFLRRMTAKPKEVAQ